MVFKRGVAKLRVSMLGDLKLRIRISLDGENYEFVVPNIHPKFVLKELKFEWAKNKVILGINGLRASSRLRVRKHQESIPPAVIVLLPARDKEPS